MVIIMANANVRLKKWIVEILEEGPLTAAQILSRIKKKGVRNVPTLGQLNSVLGKHSHLKRTEKIDNTYLWQLRD